ncbi:MAG: hypothetical protein ABJH06_05780 [Paraglaciecola sp.]|uniref:sulfotransferase n=1 Tax=Paraglaciecola sp. TaxID=1920173 RepID=UPI0032972066
MSSSVENLRKSLDKALSLIDDSHLVPYRKDNTQKDTHLNFAQSSSLLDRCSSVEKQYQNVKPILRIIHHPACSGGSLISKFLSSMPNVTLLSEIHPNTELHLNWEKPHYAPTDIITLARYSKVYGIDELTNKLFNDSIIKLSQHTRELGGYLILRDHTHADFFTTGGEMKSSLVNSLHQYFTIKSVMTVRNPVDSYLSLVKNDWVHFDPKTFEEYCARVKMMLEIYKDVPVFKYEEIIANPHQQMEELCKVLEIPFSDNFDSIFGTIRVTGDSGRSSNIISSKTRRKVDESFLKEAAASDSYKTLCNKFGY